MPYGLSVETNLARHERNAYIAGDLRGFYEANFYDLNLKFGVAVTSQSAFNGDGFFVKFPAQISYNVTKRLGTRLYAEVEFNPYVANVDSVGAGIAFPLRLGDSFLKLGYNAWELDPYSDKFDTIAHGITIGWELLVD